MLEPVEIERLYRRLRRRDPLGDLAGLEADPVDDLALNPGRRRRENDKAGRAASVLMPLVDRADEVTVLLTQRTDHLPDHPGQVSFPGGSREAGDVDPIATALREAEEEVGIAPRFVDILGTLDVYRTGTGFDVTPVIGVVDPAFRLKIDPHEVADVFEVPLGFFLDASNHVMETRSFEGRDFRFYTMPYDGYHIWGATAAMLVNLARALVVYAREE